MCEVSLLEVRDSLERNEGARRFYQQQHPKQKRIQDSLRILEKVCGDVFRAFYSMALQIMNGKALPNMRLFVLSLNTNDGSASMRIGELKFSVDIEGLERIMIEISGDLGDANVFIKTKNGWQLFQMPQINEYKINLKVNEIPASKEIFIFPIRWGRKEKLGIETT